MKAKEMIKKIIGSVMCLLFGILLFCNLCILLKGDTSSFLFDHMPLIVSGDGLDEAFSGGDLIFVRDAEKSRIDAGDVITYRAGNGFVTQRVVQKHEDGTYSLREGNTDKVNKINHSQLYGVFVGRIEGLGALLLFSATPLGMAIFIGIPAMLILISIWREDKKKEDEEQLELETV